MKPTIVMVFALSLAGQAALAFQPPQTSAPARNAPAGPAFPDTPEGKCAAAYFRAFNSGNEKLIREFETTFRSPAALAETPVDERIKRAADLRKEWGTLRVKQGPVGGDRSLSLLVACEGSGEDQIFEFQFEAGKLKAIEIRGPITPNEAAALLQPIDARARAEVIEELAGALNEAYVFPETAAKMETMLRENLSAGRYDAMTGSADFARVLTDDLQAVSHDKHLRVRPGSPGDGPFRKVGPGPSARDDYGFRKVERLPGNIGYIKFDGFHPAPEAQEVAGAALAFVSGCDALIFDVRENGGGSPVMIQFLCSYLLESPTHLNSFYHRPSGETTETWSLAEIPGKRFPADMPVYVLTSRRTFSAAEEFTYDLKCLKRATIVGQTTGGGAHPVQPRTLGDRFFATVPFARAINPITKTNWEGVGVTPDIEAPADQALEAALNDAKERLRAKPGQGG